MKEYYYLHGEPDEETGIAYLTRDCDPRVLDSVLASSTRITAWPRVSFEVREGDFADYQPNDLACLFSESLKTTIDASSSDADDLQWLPVVVTNQARETRDYFVLHVPGRIEYFDRERSIIFDEDHIVKGCLDISAIGNRCLLGFPCGNYTTIIVASPIKDAIEAAGYRGVVFSRVPTNAPCRER